MKRGKTPTGVPRPTLPTSASGPPKQKKNTRACPLHPWSTRRCARVCDNHGPLGAHPRLRGQLARLVERARLLWRPRQPVRLACSRPASASRQRLWRPALCASPAHEPPGAWLAAAPRRRSDEARPYGRLHARAPPNRRRLRGVLTCRLPPTPRVALWRRRLPLATPLGPARAGCTLRPAVRFWRRRPRLVAHLCWRRCPLSSVSVRVAVILRTAGAPSPQVSSPAAGPATASTRSCSSPAPAPSSSRSTT